MNWDFVPLCFNPEKMVILPMSVYAILFPTSIKVILIVRLPFLSDKEVKKVIKSFLRQVPIAICCAMKPQIPNIIKNFIRKPCTLKTACSAFKIYVTSAMMWELAWWSGRLFKRKKIWQWIVNSLKHFARKCVVLGHLFPAIKPPLKTILQEVWKLHFSY